MGQPAVNVSIKIQPTVEGNRILGQEPPNVLVVVADPIEIRGSIPAQSLYSSSLTSRGRDVFQICGNQLRGGSTTRQLR